MWYSAPDMQQECSFPRPSAKRASEIEAEHKHIQNQTAPDRRGRCDTLAGQRTDGSNLQYLRQDL